MLLFLRVPECHRRTKLQKDVSWCYISCTSPWGPLIDLANTTIVCGFSVAVETGWFLLHTGRSAMEPYICGSVVSLLKDPAQLLENMKPLVDL